MLGAQPMVATKATVGEGAGGSATGVSMPFGHTTTGPGPGGSRSLSRWLTTTTVSKPRRARRSRARRAAASRRKGADHGGRRAACVARRQCRFDVVEVEDTRPGGHAVRHRGHLHVLDLQEIERGLGRRPSDLAHQRRAPEATGRDAPRPGQTAARR